MGIGERIRQLRKERGLKQKELATAAGMAPNSLYLIENSSRTPSATTVERLAEALGCGPGALFPRGPQAPQPAGISEELERRVYDDVGEGWARLVPQLQDFEDLTPAERWEVFNAAWRIFRILTDASDWGFKSAVADTRRYVLIALRYMLAFYELQGVKGSTEGEAVDIEGYRRRIQLRVSS